MLIIRIYPNYVSIKWENFLYLGGYEAAIIV